MRRYEVLIVLDPDMSDEDVKSLNERYSGIIKDHAGEIIKIEDWGSKKLAYLVRKKDKGRYVLFDFVSGPELINELERQFKITEDVMKYLSVKLDDEVDLEAFKAKAEKEAVQFEANPATDSELSPMKETERPLENLESSVSDITINDMTSSAQDIATTQDSTSSNLSEGAVE